MGNPPVKLLDKVIPLAPSVDHVGYCTADIEAAILAASILVDG